MLYIKKMLCLYDNFAKPVKAVVWFTLCNFLLKGISFISAPLFTRMLSETEYGKLSVFMSYEQLIVILATWEIHLGAYQRGIFKYKNNIKKYTAATLLNENIFTCVLFLFIFIFNKQITKFTGMSLWVLIILFIYILLMPAYNFWIIRKRTNYEYKSCVAVTLLYSVINVIVPVFALKNISAMANMKFVAVLVGSSIISIIFSLPCLKYLKIKENALCFKEYWWFNSSFSAPLVLHSLSFFILAQADRIMIKQMIGDAQAAYYSVAYNFASAVIIFQNSIYQAIKPWQFKMLEKKAMNEIRQAIMSILFFIAGIIISFNAIAPEVFKIMFASNYYEAIWCISPIAAGVFFMFLYSIFVNIEEFCEKTKYVAVASIICSIINVVLNYIFVKYFGYIAAAYTTMISYILLSIGHYLFMKKALLSSDITEGPVDLKKVIFISISVVIFSLCITALNNYVYVRYFILILIAIIVFNKRKFIINLLKDIKK